MSSATVEQITNAVARRANRAAADVAAPSGATEIEPGTGGRPKYMQQTTARDVINASIPEIERALPAHVSADRLARAALTAVRTTRHMDQTTSASFLGALMTCAQLGLEPNGPLGEAYLIPRALKDDQGNRTGFYECTFMLGYRGMVKLFWNSPLAVDLDTQTVFAGDYFKRSRGTRGNKFLVHRETDDPEARGGVTHFYSVAELSRGGSPFHVMSYADVIAHRDKYVAGWRSTPWRTDFEAMAQKTCIRLMFKTLPVSLSLDMDRALAQDGAVRTETDPDAIDTVEYGDDGQGDETPA